MFGRGLSSVWLAALAVGLACNSLGEFDVDVEPIDLRVDVRLEAVTYDHRLERLYIVGSGGLVIDDLGNRWELPATLRDVIDVDGDSNIAGTLVREPRLIVVGDNGFVAVAAHPDGAEIGFDVEMVGTDADLWAVTAMRNSKFFAIVAGDDVLIVGREDEHGELVWTHPPAPPDGWGRLRALGSPRKLIGASLGDMVCVLGQAGRMVCAWDDDLDDWEVRALDTDANLTGFCEGSGMGIAVGENGVLIYDDEDEEHWQVHHTRPPVDLVACTTAYYHGVVVGADRTVYRLHPDRTLEPLVELDWQPRALDPQFGVVLVGDNGRAGYLYQSEGLMLQ